MERPRKRSSSSRPLVVGSEHPLGAGAVGCPKYRLSGSSTRLPAKRSPPMCEHSHTWAAHGTRGAHAPAAARTSRSTGRGGRSCTPARSGRRRAPSGAEPVAGERRRGRDDLVEVADHAACGRAGDGPRSRRDDVDEAQRRARPWCCVVEVAADGDHADAAALHRLAPDRGAYGPSSLWPMASRPHGPLTSTSSHAAPATRWPDRLAAPRAATAHSKRSAELRQGDHPFGGEPSPDDEAGPSSRSASSSASVNGPSVGSRAASSGWASAGSDSARSPRPSSARGRPAGASHSSGPGRHRRPACRARRPAAPAAAAGSPAGGATPRAPSSAAGVGGSRWAASASRSGAPVGVRPGSTPAARPAATASSTAWRTAWCHVTAQHADRQVRRRRIDGLGGVREAHAAGTDSRRPQREVERRLAELVERRHRHPRPARTG